MATITEKLDLNILGAGGFASEVCWAALNDKYSQYDVKGFFSDIPADQGRLLCGRQVGGPVEPSNTAIRQAHIICGVGSPQLKHKFVTKLGSGYKYGNVIHRAVEMWRERVQIGVGTVICAGSVLTVDVTIGNHVNINLNCTVGHDTRIGDFSNLSPGVHVSGRVKIEEGVDIGSGVCINPGVTLGCWSIIGAGAVVTKDVPPNSLAVGVPAVIKSIVKRV